MMVLWVAPCPGLGNELACKCDAATLALTSPMKLVALLLRDNGLVATEAVIFV
jgi:hypothetical protein